jgi:hypothetical protein
MGTDDRAAYERVPEVPDPFWEQAECWSGEPSPNLPEPDLDRLGRWLAARNDQVPDHVRDRARIEIDVDGQAITVVECSRADASEGWLRVPSARLRYTKRRHEWTLYWFDRNGEAHMYDFVQPTAKLQRLLDEIDEDPTFIFWG